MKENFDRMKKRHEPMKMGEKESQSKKKEAKRREKTRNGASGKNMERGMQQE